MKDVLLFGAGMITGAVLLLAAHFWYGMRKNWSRVIVVKYRSTKEEQ